MKKKFGIFALVMLVLTPLILTGCGKTRPKNLLSLKNVKAEIIQKLATQQDAENRSIYKLFGSTEVDFEYNVCIMDNNRIESNREEAKGYADENGTLSNITYVDGQLSENASINVSKDERGYYDGQYYYHINLAQEKTKTTAYSTRLTQDGYDEDMFTDDWLDNMYLDNVKKEKDDEGYSYTLQISYISQTKYYFQKYWGTDKMNEYLQKTDLKAFKSTTPEKGFKEYAAHTTDKNIKNDVLLYNVILHFDGNGNIDELEVELGKYFGKKDIEKGSLDYESYCNTYSYTRAGSEIEHVDVPSWFVPSDWANV